MKANELMIGDWVYAYEDLHELTHKIAIRVGSLSSGLTLQDISGKYADYDAIDPIPLTPEILEKNGWVNKEEKGWMQKGNFGDSPLMLWYIKDTGKFNPHFANELEISDLSKDGGFRLKIQCKYVHELQRALRLCGLNDLADTFKV